MALGIMVTHAPEKVAKTMAQIFTSKGKGPAHENPIRESLALTKQTLGHCRVSISTPSIETVRVRDSEFKAEHFNQDTGEFHVPIITQLKGRIEADKWVTAALGRNITAKELK